MNNIRITIGIPTANEFLHRKFVQSLMCLRLPENTIIEYSMLSGYQLPFARNRIVEEALNNNSDYVFFIDADMVFDSDLLIKLLKHDLPMVNALAFRRIHPHYPTIFKWNEDNKSYDTMSYTSGLLEVDATGMAAHLIKTEVFKKMEKPWFYYRDNIFSSDLTFCENAKKLGYKIMIDTDVKIGHIGSEQIIDESFFNKYVNETVRAKYKENV